VFKPVHDDGAQHDRCAVKFDPRGVAQQLLIDEPQLGPAQRAAEAEMLAGTQRQMSVRLPVHTETVRIIEHALVPVG
jgi:hypothetical protein